MDTRVVQSISIETSRGTVTQEFYSKPVNESKPTYKFVVPDDGDFMVLGHDFDSRFWNFEPRSSDVNLAYRKDPPDNALPETAKPIQDNFNPLSEEHQWWWRNLCDYFADKSMSKNDLDEAWISLTADSRALTDNRAAENGYINYPSGENVDNPKARGNMEIKELAMGGNIMRVLHREGSYIWVDAFDPNKDWDSIEYIIKNKPWLIQWATVSCCRRLKNGDWDGVPNVKPFPQYRDSNNYRTGAPYPLVGEGGSIRFDMNSSTNKKRLQMFNIENGVEYSPYVKR